MTPKSASNTHCPWSGDPVSEDSLTVFEGRVVGFCNPGCRDKFERAISHFRASRVPADEQPAAASSASVPAARLFREDEVDELLFLMRKLAEFEGYLDDFVITREDLLARGLGDRPDFRAYVVPSTDRATLDGMAVTYVVPWTYARAPNLVLKELYVREGARGSGVGRQLMTAVQREAKTLGAFRIVFSVLASNERAKKFYASLGAVYDDHWRNWYLPA